MMLSGKASADQPTSVKAWISLETNTAGQQQFVGLAGAAEAFDARFELVGERRGGGGTSHVTQGGTVRITPGHPVRLSQLSFGDLANVPHYSIKLRLYRAEYLVGTAEIAK